jgi:hypothetical protein
MTRVRAFFPPLLAADRFRRQFGATAKAVASKVLAWDTSLDSMDRLMG